MSQYGQVAAPTEAAQNPMILGTRIGGYYALASQVISHFKSAKKWTEDRRRYSVSIESTDRLYDIAHTWVLSQMKTDSRSLMVRTVEKYEGPRAYDSTDEATTDISLFHDDDSSHEITLDGHKVKVHVEKPHDVATNANGHMIPKPDELVLTSLTLAGKEAIVKKLRELAQKKLDGDRLPALWVLSRWGSWDKRDDLPPRRLETVILKEGQVGRLIGDLQEFLDQEDEYVRRGIPWHRGYLLWGEPGTGKTSLAKALATHFGLDLWYLPLGDLESDSDLLSLIGRVRPRSMMLLEDIDVFQASHNRDAEKGQLSMSGLLNALDGVSTPHGLITFISTNNKDELDPALLRPGRLDRQEYIGPMDDDQALRLFENFYGLKLNEAGWGGRGVPAYGRTSAVLMEVFKRHMHDPKAAYLEVITDPESKA